MCTSLSMITRCPNLDFKKSKILYLTHFWSNWVHLTADEKVHYWPIIGEYLVLFDIVVMAKYSINIVYHLVFIQFA